MLALTNNLPLPTACVESTKYIRTTVIAYNHAMHVRLRSMVPQSVPTQDAQLLGRRSFACGYVRKTKLNSGEREVAKLVVMPLLFGIHGVMHDPGKIRGMADNISGCWVLRIECALSGRFTHVMS